jgi:hypothetical protein
VSTPQPPRPFDIGDRVRTKATTVGAGPIRAGVVKELSGEHNELSRVAFDDNEPDGTWIRSIDLEIEDPGQ